MLRTRANTAVGLVKQSDSARAVGGAPTQPRIITDLAQAHNKRERKWSVTARNLIKHNFRATGT